MVGVVLIARPPFLFGTQTASVDLVDLEDIDPSINMPPAEKGTPEQRLLAVGYVVLFIIPSSILTVAQGCIIGCAGCNRSLYVGIISYASAYLSEVGQSRVYEQSGKEHILCI